MVFGMAPGRVLVRCPRPVKYHYLRSFNVLDNLARVEGMVG